MGKYLSQCVAASPTEVASGLLLCGLALHIVAPAQRYVPEPLAFLTDALWAAAPPSAATPTMAPSPAQPNSTSQCMGSRNSSQHESSSCGGAGALKGGRSNKAGGSSSSSGGSGSGGPCRTSGLSIPRVAPGTLHPAAQGQLLAARAPAQLPLVDWLQQVQQLPRVPGATHGAEAAGHDDSTKLGLLRAVLQVGLGQGWGREQLRVQFMVV